MGRPFCFRGNPNSNVLHVPTLLKLHNDYYMYMYYIMLPACSVFKRKAVLLASSCLPDVLETSDRRRATYKKEESNEH